MPRSSLIQLRRGTESEWILANPVLANGESGFATDLGKIKIGDGVKTWTQLDYFSSDSNKTTFKIQNSCGYALYSGQTVYMNSFDSSGNLPNVELFTANGNIPEHLFLGLVNANISNGNYGYITFFGEVSPLDTRGNVTTNIAVGDESWSIGDILYAHPTDPGKLTVNKPRHSILVAIVLNVSANAGKLLVRPSWNQHLSDLHDVDLAGLSDGNLLRYNQSNSIWNSSNDIDGGVV